MAVYPQIKYDPKIHRPWIEKIHNKPGEWWRIRSVDYCAVGWQPCYVDLAYSDNLEELSIWAVLNGVPVAKT